MPTLPLPYLFLARQARDTPQAPAPFDGYLRDVLLSRLGPSQAPETSLGLSAATALYSQSLASAASVISHATVDATVARRMALGRELQDWLSRLPPPFPRTLMAVRPQELLVFFQSHWVSAHAGSQLEGLPHKVASPQGVSSALSHLSTLFDQLGRRGAYDHASGTGNPCDCSEIRCYKQGYARELWQAGYQERSAVPITLAKVTALAKHLIGQLTAVGPSGPILSPLGHLEASRDLCLLLYSWHSAMRGTEGGRLCLADLHNAARQPLYPSAYTPTVAAPLELWVYPTHGTKTNKRGRNHQDPVHLTTLAERPLCPITWLWYYMSSCHRMGHPILHYLFRPLNPAWTGFKEQAYSCSSFAQMLKARLLQLGLYEGETAHSFRRGTLQSTFAQSGLLAAAQQGRIKTPQVLARYLDPHRHQH